MEIYGYQKQNYLVILSWILTVLTFGALQLIFHWWPHLIIYFTYSRCPLKSAEKLLIIEHEEKSKSHYNVATVKTLFSRNPPVEGRLILESGTTVLGDVFVSIIKNEVQNLPTQMSKGQCFVDLFPLRLFDFKKQRYIWHDEEQSFVKLKGLDSNASLAYLHQQTGLSVSEQELRQLIYGKNEISVPLQGITGLLLLEVLNPFYIFQLFSFGLWFAYDYVYYAVTILIMSTSSITMAAVQTRDSQKKLHSTVHSSDTVTVVRSDGTKVEVCSEQLVPGDIVVIPRLGCTMRCDAILLSGSCVVNESILTGESIPMAKTPLPNATSIKYDSKEHSKHTLLCGTRIIKTDTSIADIRAVVIRTGFLTVNGELVRSILYPPPIFFQFEEDSYKFIKLLSGFASVGFVYTVITKLLRGVPVTTVALEALDLVTIVVPPALPAAMAVGCVSAQARLRNNNIFCVNPKRINVAGCIDCFCFDKTGTLTEDGLDVWGVIPVVNNNFDNPVKNADCLQTRKLLQAMASCHSLCMIDGEICGDPLDVKMFEWTKGILEESNVVKLTARQITDFQDIKIIHQLPFSSSMQRMTVITKLRKEMEGLNEDSSVTIYSKGSPEVIRGLCNPNSLPKDFERKLEEYTARGFRVLGIAHKDKKLNSFQTPRQLLEKDLDLLGLIIFENRLKPQTAGVIDALRMANIRSIMVTGDNHLTALFVARKCGIVSPNQKVFLVNVEPPSGRKPSQLIYEMCRNPESPQLVQNTSSNESALEIKKSEPNSSSEFVSCILRDITCIPNATLVLTGPTWDLICSHLPHEVPALIDRCVVFSRMSPDQKQQLVLCLQSLGHYVGMCGDGANDCGALKAAHAGISLSDAESSVAAPFISKQSDVSCVIKVIREGRAALVTSLAIFKYMAGYSITQFVSVMILYSIDSNLTDVQYLFVDLFLISAFAFLLGRTEANSGPLVSQLPEISLISLKPMASLAGQLAIVVVFQLYCFLTLSEYDWYIPYDAAKSRDKGVGCFENYTLFTVSTMQYVILAVVFCEGAPHRLPLTKNWRLWLTVSGTTVFIFYLILWPDKWVQGVFELVMPPDISFRVFCIALCAVNFVLAGIFEFAVCHILPNRIRSTSKRIKKEKDV